MTVYRFKPQPDITTYELAQIHALGFIQVTGRDMSAFPPHLARHFVVADDDTTEGWFDVWASEQRAA